MSNGAPGIELRRLRAESLALLERVDPDVFDNAIDPAAAQAFVADPRHVMFLAVDGETVIGMASAFEYFHRHAEGNDGTTQPAPA